MDIWTIFSVVGLAGLIHASFQLSVSVLTLLGGHTISREKSHLNLVKLTLAMLLGAISMTIFIFCTFGYLLIMPKFEQIPVLVWMITVGILGGTGVSIWLFYYRKTKKPNKLSGTEIWIPRDMAKYLNKRSRKTKHSAEAFSLGMTSVLSEIIFIFAPILAVILSISELSPILQIAALLLYVSLANFPLFVIFCLINSGHSIAKIQIWREKNKRFLQFAAGFGLIILAIFLYIFQVIPKITGVAS